MKTLLYEYQICLLMTGLAALVVVGAYLGKLYAFCLLFQILIRRKPTNYIVLVSFGRDYLLENGGGIICL